MDIAQQKLKNIEELLSQSIVQDTPEPTTPKPHFPNKGVKIIETLQQSYYDIDEIQKTFEHPLH